MSNEAIEFAVGYLNIALLSIKFLGVEFRSSNGFSKRIGDGLNYGLDEYY